MLTLIRPVQGFIWWAPVLFWQQIVSCWKGPRRMTLVEAVIYIAWSFEEAFSGMARQAKVRPFALVPHSKKPNIAVKQIIYASMLWPWSRDSMTFAAKWWFKATLLLSLGHVPLCFLQDTTSYNVLVLMVEKSSTNRFDLVHIGPAIDIAKMVCLFYQNQFSMLILWQFILEMSQRVRHTLELDRWYACISEWI